MTAREFWQKLAGARRGRDFDREMEEEIANHLEMAQAENLRSGLSPEEARRLAAVRFGSVTSAKEAVWDARGFPELQSLLFDIRYALRGMRKSLGFPLVSVLTIAIGIGLCSMMFTVVSRMFLRPLPGVRETARLASLEAPVTYPEFEKYRDGNSGAFAAAAFIGPVPFGFAASGSSASSQPQITATFSFPSQPMRRWRRNWPTTFFIAPSNLRLPCF